MSIERRISEIEKETGIRKEPVFLIVTYDGQEKPTREAIDKAKKEAIEKNPGQDMYVLNLCGENLPLEYHGL